MTTRDGSGETPRERVRRPEPRRTGPVRAGAATPPGDGGGSATDPGVSEAVAQAVKSGYDVIAENIRQGREAAARFRQGEYNIRDVPGDLEVVLLRLIHLAREISTTTFDVCERLLKEASRPPGPGEAAVPPFRTPAAPTAPAAARADPGRMKLTVRFEGGEGAVARTAALDRPQRPTAPQHLSAGPLTPREGGPAAIADVRFETDVSVEGLIAVVTIPPGLPAGVYSGLVRAAHDEVPLGVLSVEIPG